MRFHLREGDSEQVLATCKRFGHQDPNLWVQALWSVARNKEAPTKLLADILAYIGTFKIQSYFLYLSFLYIALRKKHIHSTRETFIATNGH